MARNILDDAHSQNLSFVAEKKKKESNRAILLLWHNKTIQWLFSNAFLIKKKKKNKDQGTKLNNINLSMKVTVSRNIPNTPEFFWSNFHGEIHLKERKAVIMNKCLKFPASAKMNKTEEETVQTVDRHLKIHIYLRLLYLLHTFGMLHRSMFVGQTFL